LGVTYKMSWGTHMTFNIQPSPGEIGLPLNFERQSHFLEPVTLMSTHNLTKQMFFFRIICLLYLV